MSSDHQLPKQAQKLSTFPQ